MKQLTWQQVALVTVVFAAVVIAVRFVPGAEMPVTSLAFTVFGSVFLNKRNEEKEEKDATPDQRTSGK